MKSITIGRLNTCDIVISDTTVSRMHAKIEVDNGRISVSDLNSKNGTYVNGAKVYGTQTLKEYDILKVGNALVQWKNYVDFNANNNGTNVNDEPNEYVNIPTVGDWMIYMLLGAIPIVNIIMLIIWATKKSYQDIVLKNYAVAVLWFMLIAFIFVGFIWWVFLSALVGNAMRF